MVVTYPEIRLVGLTLGVDGQRIDDVVRHADDGWQACIHSDGQPLYGGTLDTVAWAETGTEGMEQFVAAAQSSVNGILVFVAVVAAAGWWIVRHRVRKTAPPDMGEVSMQWIAQHRSAPRDGAH